MHGLVTRYGPQSVASASGRNSSQSTTVENHWQMSSADRSLDKRNKYTSRLREFEINTAPMSESVDLGRPASLSSISNLLALISLSSTTRSGKYKFALKIWRTWPIRGGSSERVSCTSSRECTRIDSFHFPVRLIASHMPVTERGTPFAFPLSSLSLFLCSARFVLFHSNSHAQPSSIQRFWESETFEV